MEKQRKEKFSKGEQVIWELVVASSLSNCAIEMGDFQSPEMYTRDAARIADAIVLEWRKRFGTGGAR